jgi:GAF domain-containing protein
MMIMSSTSSTLFDLNPVASAIWQAADGETTLTEIVIKLLLEFDTDLEMAYRDAEELVGELAGHGILIILDQPLRSSTAAAPGAAVGRSLVREEQFGRRPYEKPAFRYERAFETTALSCGKAQSTQGQCQVNRKVS